MPFIIELAPGIFVGKTAKRKYNAEVTENMAYRFKSVLSASIVNLVKNGAIRTVT